MIHKRLRNTGLILVVIGVVLFVLTPTADMKVGADTELTDVDSLQQELVQARRQATEIAIYYFIAGVLTGAGVGAAVAGWVLGSAEYEQESATRPEDEHPSPARPQGSGD